jgi:linoleoyl-CoA desaturase
MGHSFFEHQLYTSVDYHPFSPWFSFFFGGFNAHVAHHMFPNVSSEYYPEVTRVIERVAGRHQLPYQQTTLLGVITQHFQRMKHLGMSDA